MDKSSDIDTSTVIKELSLQDFLNVGLNQVAYIRPVSNEDNKEAQYIIYSADGVQISVMDSYDTAIAAIKINDLFPVTLQ